MIRGIAVLSSLCLLVLVFYLPSVYPAQRFATQLLHDRSALNASWHPQAAVNVLQRYWRWKLVPLATAHTTHDPGPSSAAENPELKKTLSEVRTRVMGNPYFGSFRAMLDLAVYRWATLLEWLPLVLAPGVAMIVDGGVTRKIQAHGFTAHNPEALALATVSLILTLTLQAAATVVPLTLHPWLLPGCQMITFLSLARMLAHYHHPHR